MENLTTKAHPFVTDSVCPNWNQVPSANVDSTCSVAGERRLDRQRHIASACLLI